MRVVSAGFGLALLAAVLGPTSILAQDKDKVEIKVVKYAGLADTIKALKGKVVLVDFWQFY